MALRALEVENACGVGPCPVYWGAWPGNIVEVTGMTWPVPLKT